MKHTPGPWRTDGDNNFPRDVYAGDLLIATAYEKDDNVRVDDGPEACANARLIAAAPELLEVLNAVMDRVRAEDMGPLRDIPVFQDAWEKAMVVIAKAEGR